MIGAASLPLLLVTGLVTCALVGCAGGAAPARRSSSAEEPEAPAPSTAAALSARPVRRTVHVDGQPLALWEKRPAAPRGSILFVHGRSWSSLPNFDLRVDGGDRSVMNAFVRAGYAAYALDMRGYGASPRDATGWLTPTRAADDVAAALDFVRALDPAHAAPVLVGYSRGSSVAMLAAQRHPASLAKLVLYGFPAEGARPAPPVAEPAAPARAPNTAANAASDFVTPGSVPQRVVDAYVEQALASDPIHADWRREDEFVFDPASVRAPTLVLYGAGDPRAASPDVATFFSKLGAEDRAWIVLPRSDHAAHVEDAQPRWVRAILDFVDPKAPRAASAGPGPAP